MAQVSKIVFFLSFSFFPHHYCCPIVGKKKKILIIKKVLDPLIELKRFRRICFIIIIRKCPYFTRICVFGEREDYCRKFKCSCALKKIIRPYFIHNSSTN